MSSFHIQNKWVCSMSLSIASLRCLVKEDLVRLNPPNRYLKSKALCQRKVQTVNHQAIKCLFQGRKSYSQVPFQTLPRLLEDLIYIQVLFLKFIGLRPNGMFPLYAFQTNQHIQTHYDLNAFWACWMLDFERWPANLPNALDKSGNLLTMLSMKSSVASSCCPRIFKTGCVPPNRTIIGFAAIQVFTVVSVTDVRELTGSRSLVASNMSTIGLLLILPDRKSVV